MFVAGLVAEQLESDGSLRTFKMWAQPGREFTVAFADEYAEPRRGPFHFVDEQDEQAFGQGFGEARLWKLPESRFKFAEGLGIFRTSWRGIPTEENRLSYHALSLPEFAIPLEIQFTNPRSNRIYSKTVIRDDHRNRFVTCLGWTSARGSFDFSLKVTFRYDEQEFRRAEYADSHIARDPVHIFPEDLLLPVDATQIAALLAQNSYQPQVALPAQPRTPSLAENTGPKNSGGPGGKEADPFAGLPANKRDLSEHFNRADLTEIQHQVISLRLEYGLSVSEIAKRLRRSRKTIDEHIQAASKKINHGWSAVKRAAKGSEPPRVTNPPGRF